MTGLFVYGMLMRGEALHYLIQKDAVSIEAATTRGRLLDCVQYAALEPGPRGVVHGEYVELANDALLGLLDHTEGCDDGWYHRVTVEVRTEGGETKTAWAYAGGTVAKSARGVIESGDWRRR